MSERKGQIYRKYVGTYVYMKKKVAFMSHVGVGRDDFMDFDEFSKCAPWLIKLSECVDALVCTRRH